MKSSAALILALFYGLFVCFNSVAASSKVDESTALIHHKAPEKKLTFKDFFSIKTIRVPGKQRYYSPVIVESSKGFYMKRECKQHEAVLSVGFIESSAQTASFKRAIELIKLDSDILKQPTREDTSPDALGDIGELHYNIAVFKIDLDALSTEVPSTLIHRAGLWLDLSNNCPRKIDIPCFILPSNIVKMIAVLANNEEGRRKSISKLLKDLPGLAEQAKFSHDAQIMRFNRKLFKQKLAEQQTGCLVS